MDEWTVFPREAVAVGTMAIQQGVARKDFSAEERFRMAAETIRIARAEVQARMNDGFIADPDR